MKPSDGLIVARHTYVTRDYKFFADKKISSNRKVNDSHVKALIKSFTKSFEKNPNHYIQPVTLNQDGKIVDGQHRIEALTILQKPIEYVIVEGLSAEDIGCHNSNQKPWKGEEYIDYHCLSSHQETRESYVLFKEFMKRYGFNSSAILSLLTDAGGGDSKQTRQTLKDGLFRSKHIDLAHRNAQNLTEFREYLGPTVVTNRHFIAVAIQAFRHSEYNQKHFLHKLRIHSAPLKPGDTTEGYKKAFMDIYNWNLKKAPHVELFTKR